MRRPATLALFLSLAAATLAGCSSGSMAQSDVEDKISTELAAQVGQTPDDVTCPGDLKAEVGATMTCVLTDGDQEINVDLKVTSVDGSNMKFDIQVADQAN